MVPTVPRPYSGPELEVAESWTPYPLAVREKPGYYRRIRDEYYNLATLSHDILRLLYSNALVDPLRAWGEAQSISERFMRWYHALPKYLEPTEDAAVHILMFQ